MPPLEARVRAALDAAPLTDLHTHLYAPSFGPLMLWGLDELLSYHYLAAETLRSAEIQPQDFYALPKARQAERAWQELFVERSPLSEACRGVLTALKLLGLKGSLRDLDKARAWFRRQERGRQIDLVFKAAKVRDVVMTNDPLDDAERAVWEKGHARDPRFHAALRLDPLLEQWRSSQPKLKALGYKVKPRLDAATLAELRRFLAHWTGKMKPLYLACSLPPSFDLDPAAGRTVLLEKVILPFCHERGLPFALMLGVRRGVNPALRQAGDALGRSPVSVLEALCLRHPRNKFLATVLAREDQHQLAVAGRKFSNLLVFGCWWFMNIPSLVRETTAMRLELLGLGFVPQHSDARVLEQLLYKWHHARADIAVVLAQKYRLAAESGWQASNAELARDAAALMGGNFWRFLKRRT